MATELVTTPKAGSITGTSSGPHLPTIIAQAGDNAARRFIEFFTATIRNGNTRRAYARADYWEERVRMMAWWADRCAELKRGGVVVPLRA